MTRVTQTPTRRHLTTDRATAAEHEAYRVLEECRLRCEQLHAAGVARSVLHDVHRGFGLAGYYVSSQLPTEARYELLAHARKDCGSPVTDTATALIELGAAVDRAIVAVDAALNATVLADHAHLAQVHLIEADEALQDLTVTLAR